MLVTAIVGAVAALGVTGDRIAFEAAIALAVPSAMAALAGAAVSVITDPFAWVLNPVAQNLRAAAPFVLAIIGVLPIVLARYAYRHDLPPVGAVIQVGVFVVLLSVGVLVVLTGFLAPKEQAA
jgi:hypothetical protein